MITTISGTRKECDLTAAKIIAKSIARILSRKKMVVLGLPGGRSVQGIFRLWAGDTAIPWQRVQLFWVDERLVPRDDPESNYRLAKELFLDELIQRGKLPNENIHPFDYRSGVIEYQKTLARYGGQYDLVLLGVGEDGHIAGLFPHHPGLRKKNTFFTLNDAPKPPPQRMTIGPALVGKAEVAIALFYGKEKQPAWKAFRNPLTTVEDCPAKLIVSIREVYTVTDLQL